MKPSTSTAVWRCFIVSLAIIAGTQFFIELISLPRILTLGVRAERLDTSRFLPERGPTTFIIDSIPPASPLVAAGVQPGDRLRYDRPLDRWYSRVAGDKLSLTVIRGDSSRHVEVVMPAADSLPRYAIATQVLGALTSLLALVLGVAVGWRRTDSIALRALAVASLQVPLTFPFSAPEAIHLLWLDYLGSVATALGPGAMVFFAVNYPDDSPVGLRAIIKRVYPWLFGLHVIAAVIYMGRLYSGYLEPLAFPVFMVAGVVEPVLFLAAILLGWHNASGESRVRFQWILGTLGAIMTTILAGKLNNAIGSPIPAELFDVTANVAVLVAVLGFTYAIFRHRVFDFGFAINRALVYGVVTLILLLAFFGLEKLAEHNLHVESREKNALLDGGIALVVFLFFHRVRHAVEHYLERLFFSKWHNNEKALRHFIKQAEHITRSDALMAALTVELDRFTDAAGNATYRRDAEGHFERAAGTLEGAPEIIDANEPMVVALRTNRLPTRCSDTKSYLSFAVALPMTYRADLDGFVLIGGKLSKPIYRPDEMELLGFAANQIGLDLHALEAEELRQDATEHEREVALLRANNREMRMLVELALAGQTKLKQTGEQ